MQSLVLIAAKDASNLGTTLIPSAYNIGIAFGAVAGSLLLDAGGGYETLPVVGVGASLVAAGIAVLSGRERSTTKSTATP